MQPLFHMRQCMLSATRVPWTECMRGEGSLSAIAGLRGGMVILKNASHGVLGVPTLVKHVN